MYLLILKWKLLASFLLSSCFISGRIWIFLCYYMTVVYFWVRLLCPSMHIYWNFNEELNQWFGSARKVFSDITILTSEQCPPFPSSSMCWKQSSLHTAVILCSSKTGSFNYWNQSKVLMKVYAYVRWSMITVLRV